MTNKITSIEQWGIYLASIAASFEGKDVSTDTPSTDEANNFRYKATIKNVTKDVELQDFIRNVKIIPNRSNSKIQSAKATFALDEGGLVDHGDIIEFFVRNAGEDFELKVLSGKVKIENNKVNNYGILSTNISVFDEVEKLYSKIVPEDIFMFDAYLNNNNDKANSIFHTLLRKIGFEDSDLEIDDIRNSNGSLIRIPFMLFKEDNRWIDELFTALDSVGARININPYGKVKIESGLENKKLVPVYEFTKANILSSFETKDIHPDKNGSKIVYDNYRYLENQIIFGLAEKVEVKVGVTPETNQKSMKIQYISDLAKSYNLTKAEGYWYQTEDASSMQRVSLVEGVHYKFDEMKSSGSVVKFFNPFPKTFYIDVFEISGIPLVKYEDNEYSFKNLDVVEKNDENFHSGQKNKYIQEESLAAEVGKIIFLDKCKVNTEYSFKCNFVPFLDAGDICRLDFLEKDELVRITSIEHNLTSDKGCTSNIKVQKVIYLTPEEYKNSSLESLNVSTSFIELKNFKEEIKDLIEDSIPEIDSAILGKIGAKAYIVEEEPITGVKDYDVWYKPSKHEFKVYMNGKWNVASENDIMPSLKSWIATQTAQLEMGKIIETVGDDVSKAHERAGIFLMNNDEKFGSMNGSVAEVSIDKEARILAKNANNLLEFNTKDPAKPNVMTSKILMGVYDVNDTKHKNTAFQVGDESTGNYIKFDMAGGVSNVIGNKDITEWISDFEENAKELIEELGVDLQNQIDSKIDTWNQESDPAVAWTTDALKSAHNGDLWYKPTEKTTRRYRRTGVNSGIWEVLEAKDTVAQSLAQSKKRIFTAQPISPYEVGDLWITNLTATADLMVCRTALSSGAYNSAHWIKGTKYTDDTTANGVQDNLSNGRFTINANSTFNGDATIVSKGTGETTEIRGGSITFTRNGNPVTTYRNSASGSIATNGSGSGFVDFQGLLPSLHVVTSIKGFNVTSNVRTLNCYAEKDPSATAQNRWRFYIFGTQEDYLSEVPVTTGNNVYAYNTPNCYIGALRAVQTTASGTKNNISFSGTLYTSHTSEVLSSGKIRCNAYIDGSYYGYFDKTLSGSITVNRSGTNFSASVNERSEIITSGVSKTTGVHTVKAITWSVQVLENPRIRIRCQSWNSGSESDQFYNETSDSDVPISVSSVVGLCAYNTSQISNIVGGGTVSYLAMEVGSGDKAF